MVLCGWQAAATAVQDRRRRRGKPEHPNATYQCPVCHRKFTQGSSLGRHFKTLHAVGDVRLHRCHVCCKIFSQKSEFKAHQMNGHGIGDVKRLKCQQCNTLFNVKGTCKQHLRNQDTVPCTSASASALQPVLKAQNS